MWSAEELGKDELTISPDGRGFVNVHGDSTKLSQYMNHLIPLQFTGLEDKDGKDIWEGDIIKDEEDVIGDVFFGDGGFRVDYKRRGIYFVSDREQSEIEVIGNIYENPKLLEGK